MLFIHCFSHNSTQKAPPDELLVRFFTKGGDGLRPPPPFVGSYFDYFRISFWLFWYIWSVLLLSLIIFWLFIDYLIAYAHPAGPRLGEVVGLLMGRWPGELYFGLTWEWTLACLTGVAKKTQPKHRCWVAITLKALGQWVFNLVLYIQSFLKLLWEAVRHRKHKLFVWWMVNG